jgi:flagellar basal body-associated protein FliL
MAGKEEKAAAKPEAAAGEGGHAENKKGLPKKAIIVAVAVVILEVATVGVTVMMSGGPQKIMADPPTTATKPAEEHKEKEAEVKLMDGRLPNRRNAGRLYLYDMSVVAKVYEKNKEKVKGLIEEMDAEIKDRIRTIVASSGAEALDEPGLETLRRQIKYQLEHDLGKDMIVEILIPKCIPNRQD